MGGRGGVKKECNKVLEKDFFGSIRLVFVSFSFPLFSPIPVSYQLYKVGDVCSLYLSLMTISWTWSNYCVWLGHIRLD